MAGLSPPRVRGGAGGGRPERRGAPRGSGQRRRWGTYRHPPLPPPTPSRPAEPQGPAAFTPGAVRAPPHAPGLPGRPPPSTLPPEGAGVGGGAVTFAAGPEPHGRPGGDSGLVGESGVRPGKWVPGDPRPRTRRSENVCILISDGSRQTIRVGDRGVCEGTVGAKIKKRHGRGVQRARTASVFCLPLPTYGWFS